MRQCFYKLLLLTCILQPLWAFGQNAPHREKTIKGWDCEVLPSFVYNTDKGLQYGALASIYYYGDSSHYPNYKYNLYLQSSLTTKKGYVDYLFFDVKNLFSKNIRLTTDLTFLQNGFQQFYGFNGYNAVYNHGYELPSSNDYISRSYYYMHKITWSALVNLKAELPVHRLYWNAGVGYYNVSTNPFTINNTPNNPPTLFEKYINNGVIPSAQAKGGITTYLKTGLIFNTRDDESFPTKGVWIEAVYINAPGVLNNKFSYSQAAFIHRQYFTLLPNFIFAYRLDYQTKLTGEMPYYMLPYLVSSFRTAEALGGAKTIRGVLNERIEGDGFFLGNFEFRYIFMHTVLLNYNIKVALNTFADMGQVTRLYNINGALNEAAFDYKRGTDKMHYGTGAGLKFIMNHNFIVSLDYGFALCKQDGNQGFYLDLNYLF